MEKQTDVNEKMRAILIDWLVDVHLKFELRVCFKNIPVGSEASKWVQTTRPGSTSSKLF